MDDFARLESKIDALTEMMYGLKTDTFVRLSLLEQSAIITNTKISENDSELKLYKLAQENIIAKILTSIQPMTNLRWAMIQIPSLLAVMGSIVAILKVFKVL